MFWGGKSSSNSSSFLSSNNSNNTNALRPSLLLKHPGLQFRKYLDRVDILGYGPTHPRVAVVVVGEDRDDILASIESVFRNTDLNRLFLICAVMDGVKSDTALVKKSNEMDEGAIPHWHGLHQHFHLGKFVKSGDDEDENSEDVEPHGKKTYVMFSEDLQGMAASRNDAVEFISLLEKKHEQAGIKSPEEDLIVLFLQSGAELISPQWLKPVTSALIVPPPLLGEYRKLSNGNAVPLKIANAVSFPVQNDDGDFTRNEAVGFDAVFSPRWITPKAQDLALSNGNSFPSPGLAGAATAMRLATYRSLPSQDLSLQDEYAVNLDLALNLWLCADGIDILNVDSTRVKTRHVFNAKTKLPSTNLVARFAAAWLDSEYAAKTLKALINQESFQLTRLEWDTMLSYAKEHPDFPNGLQNKCRPFTWFADNINTAFDEEGEGPKRGNEEGISAKQGLKKKEPAAFEEKNISPENPMELPPAAEKSEGNAVPERKEDRQLEQKKLEPPLSFARLEIIRKAKPVEIHYVKITPEDKHPHMGARDADGNLDYVHDATALRKNPPDFEFPALHDACDKRDNTYKMLTEQVFVDMKSHEEKKKSGVNRDKIFCLVYTISSGHSRIPYIQQTWGPKCDGFMVGSNKTDVSIGAVNIPHEGPEEYNNIWQKVRSMWSYIYDNYYNDYDWFHIGGDDLYLIVENLRLYLESDEIQAAQNGGIYLPSEEPLTHQTPLFLGRRFAYMGDMDDIFLSGGSGYTMNKAALKTLVVDGFPKYFPHMHTFSEDTMTARIFRKFNIFPYETKDNAGSERYNPFQPGHHWSYRPPADISKDWYAKYSIDVRWGKEHCSKHSVAFHYIKDDMQKRLHALLYHLCPSTS